MLRSFAVLLTVVLFALLNTCNAHITRVFKCPCTFSVSRKVFSSAEKEAFDVLVQPFASVDRAPNTGDLKVIEEHSSRNLRISDAVHTSSGYYSFKNMAIKEKGLFRVRIRHQNSRTAQRDPEYTLELQTSAKQVICPVVLQPDTPRPTTGRVRMPNAEQSLESAIRRIKQRSMRIPKIVGGLLISPSLQPYLVAIRIPSTCSDGSSGCFSGCTGTILSKRWVMTAAHCEVTPGSAVVVNTISNRVGSFTLVSRAFSNPAYDPDVSLDNDIAVLETVDDMDTCCGVNPQFMPLNTRSDLPLMNSFVRAAGYGAVSEDGSIPVQFAGLVRQVDVPVVPFSTCQSAYRNGLSEAREVCAGYFNDGGCDSCFGDSGGPLMQYSTDGTPVMVGITSFGVGCARPGFPGVYERPDAHLAYLDSVGAVYTRFSGQLETTIVDCDRGEFLPFIPQLSIVSTCTPCPDDQFSMGGIIRVCQQCPANLMRDTRRGDRCSCRAVAGSGRRRDRRTRELMCRPCKRGQSSPVGEEKCQRCPAGSYAPMQGMSECLPCPGARRGAKTCDSVPLPTAAA